MFVTIGRRVSRVLASLLLFFIAAVAVSYLSDAHAATVFSADFEAGAVAADIGTLTITNGNPSIVDADGAASQTDWGEKALWADRTASSGSGAGFNMEWGLTDTVLLDGAVIDFEFALRRTNTSDVKSHFVTAFDSNDNKLFSIILIDREDSGLANIDPEYTEPSESNERQRQTVGYDDPINGASLFVAADLASGVIPDSNDRSGGSNSFTFFFGNDNRDDPVSEEQAGIFSISLSSTGWALDAQSREAGTSLADFTTNELPFFDAGVANLARIEIDGETVQAGGYWDNFSVTGTIVPEPASGVLFCIALVWLVRSQRLLV